MPETLPEGSRIRIPTTEIVTKVIPASGHPGNMSGAGRSLACGSSRPAGNLGMVRPLYNQLVPLRVARRDRCDAVPVPTWAPSGDRVCSTPILRKRWLDLRMSRRRARRVGYCQVLEAADAPASAASWSCLVPSGAGSVSGRSVTISSRLPRS
jgi:hypothetical protein